MGQALHNNWNFQRVKPCQVCGEPVQTYNGKLKWCKNCREKAYQAAKRRARKRHARRQKGLRPPTRKERTG